MIDKYKQAFQEEAREILVELESCLLELNENREDKELVGRAFRALHTIKGSGAMFGFDDIAAFTHHVENAFDEVRNGRLGATPDLISISLAAVDQIKLMLDEAAGQATRNPAACSALLAKLEALTGTSQNKLKGTDKSKRDQNRKDENRKDKNTNDQPAGLKPADEPAENSPSGAECAIPWRIHFRPGADLIRTGTNPLLLLRELRGLGTLEVKANTDDVPPLNELDPERCYISWEMTLITAASSEAIHDVFIFVEDTCELKIEKIAASAAPVEPAASVGAAENVAAEAAATARRASDKATQTASIRVAAAKLDQLVDLIGQLVTVQARLGDIAARSEDRDMQAVVEEVEALTSELRENSMSMRTLPLRSTFERMKRLVYDLGRQLHKEVELTFEGGDTELDKTVIDQLNDPLMHLIRNCMDHGIEPAEARRAASKPAVANVHLSARHAGAQVLISVSDDGKGIDREAVRAKAVEKGLIAADARLSEQEVFSLILAPGFSTAAQVTDVSGRGVGMDVVRRNVETLRGSIEIASQPGLGSTVTLRLPLTLAIIDGLLVRVGEAFFVLPLATTVECIELKRQDIEKANGKHVAHVRGQIIPYVRLGEFFQMRSERPEREQIMIAETEQGRYGLVVDQVLGDHQTVIKNLGRFYRHVQFVSGATILGNGNVALILDPHRLVQDAIRTMPVGMGSNELKSQTATTAG